MKYNIVFIMILMISIIGCNKNTPESADEEHNHDHGMVKLKLTEYSDQFEVFAEADPFVIGNTSNILAHFTRLHDFKPLMEGSVTARIIVGETEVKQTVDKPVRTGIYEFTLKPETNGAGKLIFDIKDEKGSHQIVVNQLMVYNDEHTAVHIAEKKIIDEINSISFTKEQSWKIDFATENPSNELFGEVIKSTARILPNQNSEMIITAKTNGIIKFQKNLLEGQAVSAGETLLIISGNGLANENAEVRFREANTNYNLAKSEYDRKNSLSQNKIVSESELESAKANYENAKVIFDNLKANFSIAGQVVNVSQAGVVKHVQVSNGQYVSAGDALFSIVHNNTLIVKAEVQQKYYPFLNSITSVNIKSSIDGKVYNLSELQGKVLSYGKSIDENDGYLIPVHFQIENNSKFLSGSFVEVFIKTQSSQKALLVPNTSLVEEQGNFFVFVQLTPELFEKREVKVGVSDGIKTEIIKGLSVSERIVSKGAIIVKLAAVSNSLDPHAGHVH